MHPRAAELIASLGLGPHPEGGFYREIYRDEATVPHPTKGATRSCVTCIYFLLPAGTFSALHRVAQSEIWHHLEGDKLDLHVIDERGAHAHVVLGKDLAAGERMQQVVHAGAWQAAVPIGDAYVLCGCTVAPGFDFADFELPTRGELVERFPQHRALVERLTRP
jgi:predicted cupin superfamily sugar epimerase